MEHLPLKDVADVSYGRPVSRYVRSGRQAGTRRRKDAPEPRFEPARIMTVSALATWPDSAEALELREIDMTRAESFAREGDVIVGLSSPFPSACVDEQDLQGAPIFIPNSCAIVRAGDRLDPWYLTGYLNLDIMRSEALPRQSGGGRAPMLNVDQLRELRIHVPPLAVQAALAKLSREHVQLASARRIADRRDRELMSAAFSRALEGGGRA